MSDISLFLHPPSETTSRFVEWAEQRTASIQSGTTIDYGCAIDQKIIPLCAGDLMAVVARPGHGKSSFMAYMAKRVAQKISASESDDKCVVYVSWEQPVEELEAFFQSVDSYSSTDLAWGKVSLDTVKRNAIQRINLPIWMMGYSIKDAKKKKPPMTIDMVYESIRKMHYDYGFQPALICFDYLQIIPVKNADSRVEQVTEATIAAKHFAMEIGAPIIGGVQASRETDKRAMQIPTLADAQWSSAIEQTADKQLSLFRPIRAFEEGEFIPIGSKEKMYLVNDYLMVIKLLKQRFDSGSGIWPVHFEPHTLNMHDIFPQNGK